MAEDLRGAGPAGLTGAEARARLGAVGRNEIPREGPRSRWRILAGQFTSPLVWLLLGAAVVSGFMGDVVDTAAIGAIVVINALVGFAQEHRAETALLALRAMTAPHARVLRDGQVAVVEAAEVVPGDVLVLEAGDVVAADARLLEAHRLTANEAALTGESLPVAKAAQAAPEVRPDVPPAERTDLVFMGTTLATGTGRAGVVATGTRTELGHVARLVSTAEQGQTPLERRLARVGTSLLILCVGIVVVVAALGLLRGERPLAVLLSAVSLAVAAVPEGLPAIVTIALAVGVQRMAARHVLVRRLAAVDALGCATVICTDKTGTLTTGVMAVREVWGEDHRAVLAAAAACCDADLAPDGHGGSGDPTEVAILAAAAGRGVFKDEIERTNPREAVTPFDPERRWMAIGRRDGRAFFKGAVEVLGAAAPAPVAAATEMAARGLRVLAVAIGSGGPEDPGRAALVGLLGIADPPRTEAIAAVADARRAGVRTVMITGDHPVTALAIARELGLLAAGEDPAQIVHARATPAEKLEIVRAWKERGAVVAMTGDGVNDAPALREAHVGIAMGKTGTEVAREASDMVLADDDFASIVAAIQEGRGVFENIRKSLLYLLSGNVGELGVMLVAAILGLPLPLLPLQILWVNLVTDGLPALGLVMDPADPDALARPPRRPDEPMLGSPEWRLIVAVGALHCAITLCVFRWALPRAGLDEARTLAFSTLVFGQVFLAVGFRHREKVLWALGVFTNLRLAAVVVFTALIQLALVVFVPTRALLHLASLAPSHALVPVVAGLIPVTLLELSKLTTRRRAPASAPSSCAGVPPSGGTPRRRWRRPPRETRPC
jgi:Ca2+-transporting ATPase